jgi:hypothetical protein
MVNRVSFILYLFVIAVGGCRELTNSQEPNTLLPPEAYGIWRAEDPASRLEIEIGPDGEVVSAVVSPGGVKVYPNTTTNVEMLNGKISKYQAGSFLVAYDAEMRELNVSIDLLHLEIFIGDDKLEGEKRDFFSGTVSEDGELWDATWLEVFDYGPRLPMDKRSPGEPMRFVKVYQRGDNAQ